MTIRNLGITLTFALAIGSTSVSHAADKDVRTQDIVQTQPDGSKTVITPSGTVTNYNADGSVVTPAQEQTAGVARAQQAAIQGQESNPNPQSKPLVTLFTSGN
jgi:hypothetical protein